MLAVGWQPLLWQLDVVQDSGKGAGNVVVVVFVVVRVRSNVKTNGCLFVADDDKLFPTSQI